MLRPPSYRPISDYGVIGNLRTVALVGRDGSIDWCCFPNLDRASAFGALLDSRAGGRFRIFSPGARGRHEYVPDTNILRTEFRGAGALTVTDFMPLLENIREDMTSEDPPEIHRLLECSGGVVEVELEWSPRFDYGAAGMRIERLRSGWLASGFNEVMTLANVGDGSVLAEGADGGPAVTWRFTLEPGEKRVVVARWGGYRTLYDLEESVDMLHRTARNWRDWAHMEEAVHGPEWAGDWVGLLTRSELALKLLINADTGAIAAAPTTSLPEDIGGVRNWDYRYAWIRDAALTAQSLIALGHRREAVRVLHWMEDVSHECRRKNRAPQVMYGLHGETDLRERKLSHLEGYRASRPVLVGNEAATQFQLEVYGELLTTGYELARRGEALAPEIEEFLRITADHVARVWRDPDHGIWEVRAEPRHFTYSKLMAWVALDRAVTLNRRFGMAGDARRWAKVRREIRDDVLENGFDRELGAFVQHYGGKELDAANLRVPFLEFLDAEDPRVQGTIDRTMERLSENDLVYRYRSDDGLPGEEGTFCICTFWLVDALALSGRMEEAERVYEGIAGRVNDLGLLSEQIDPHTGEFLGNFPQAFTHIGLITSRVYLAYTQGRRVPEAPPVGTQEHRREAARARGFP